MGASKAEARVKRASLAAALLFCVAAVAHAEPVDWNAANQHEVIELLTTDPDGKPRETKVWIAEMDGRGYVRTNDSRWYQNFVRDPNGVIRYGGAEFPIRAEIVKDDALRARVDAVFAKKYPLSMKIAGFFGRHGGDNCLALSASGARSEP
jgi:hypothetical protein